MMMMMINDDQISNNTSSDEFNWYYVKQQLELFRALVKSSPDGVPLLMVYIKKRIVRELDKLDGMRSSRDSYIESGAGAFNPSVLAVLCTTCFSEREQLELLELLLNTHELVTCDDVYCAILETCSSFDVLARILDAYKNQLPVI